MGISYLKVYLKSNHAFLFSVWGRDDVSYGGNGSFSSSSFESRLSDPHDHLYDVEALDKRKNNTENKWLSYGK